MRNLFAITAFAALGAVHAKEIKLGLTDDLSPAVLLPTDDQDTLAVVMPMRI